MSFAFLISVTNNFIDKNPTKPAVIPAKRYGINNWLDLVNSDNSFVLLKAAPRIAGMDKRKENFVARVLFNPLNKPEVIVVPDLDMPGRIAQLWATPTTKELRKSTFSLLVFLTLSDRKSIVPVINNIKPTKVKFSNINSNCFSKTIPIIPVITVANKI